jgi:hypothetical protein
MKIYPDYGNTETRGGIRKNQSGLRGITETREDQEYLSGLRQHRNTRGPGKSIRITANAATCVDHHNLSGLRQRRNTQGPGNLSRLRQHRNTRGDQEKSIRIKATQQHAWTITIYPDYGNAETRRDQEIYPDYGNTETSGDQENRFNQR